MKPGIDPAGRFMTGFVPESHSSSKPSKDLGPGSLVIRGWVASKAVLCISLYCPSWVDNDTTFKKYQYKVQTRGGLWELSYRLPSDLRNPKAGELDRLNQVIKHRYTV